MLQCLDTADTMLLASNRLVLHLLLAVVAQHRMGPLMQKVQQAGKWETHWRNLDMVPARAHCSRCRTWKAPLTERRAKSSPNLRLNCSGFIPTSQSTKLKDKGHLLACFPIPPFLHHTMSWNFHSHHSPLPPRRPGLKVLPRTPYSMLRFLPHSGGSWWWMSW